MNELERLITKTALMESAKKAKATHLSPSGCGAAKPNTQRYTYARKVIERILLAKSFLRLRAPQRGVKAVASKNGTHKKM